MIERVNSKEEKREFNPDDIDLYIQRIKLLKKLMKWN